MNMFDPELAYVFSFGPKSQEIMESFRVGIIAGICNVFARHINLMDDLSPHNSRFSPSGERYTNFAFYDFNLHLEPRSKEVFRVPCVKYSSLLIIDDIPPRVALNFNNWTTPSLSKTRSRVDQVF